MIELMAYPGRMVPGRASMSSGLEAQHRLVQSGAEESNQQGAVPEAR